MPTIYSFANVGILVRPRHAWDYQYSEERFLYVITYPRFLSMLQACDVLLRSKHVFQDLASENPNKANMADYIEAIIEAR